MKKATRHFLFNVFCGSFVVLFVSIIAIQAIANIKDGKWIGNHNYQWQPLGPGIQLSFVAAVVICGAVAVWQHFIGKGKKK